MFAILILAVKGVSMLIEDTASQIGEQSDKISLQFKQKLEPTIITAEEWFGIEILEDSDFLKNNIEEVLTSQGFGNAVKFSIGTAKNLLQG